MMGQGGSMTYGYDDHTPIPARSRTDRLIVWSVGLTLTVIGVASAIYLADQYRAAAPWRAAQESERLREREARAAEDARREAIEAQRAAEADAALNPQVPVITAPAPDLESMSEEELRRYLEQQGVIPGGAPATTPGRTSRDEPVSGPLEWAVRPRWPALRDYTFPAGVSRIRVDFGCRVSRTGVLSDCRATEIPSGTGLAARMRPALADARMQPMTRGGRAVDGEATIGVFFDARPPAPVVERPRPPVEDAAPAAPAAAPASAPPPTDDQSPNPGAPSRAPADA